MEAIRDACCPLETFDLAGAQMYASTEPCALCVCAMMLTGFSRLYYAASLDQAVRVQATVVPEPGDPVIDPSAVREEAGSPVDRRRIRSDQKLDARPLVCWRSGRRGRQARPNDVAKSAAVRAAPGTGVMCPPTTPMPTREPSLLMI